MRQTSCTGWGSCQPPGQEKVRFCHGKRKPIAWHETRETVEKTFQKKRHILRHQAVIGFGALGGKARRGGHGGYGGHVGNEEDDNLRNILRPGCVTWWRKNC